MWRRDEQGWGVYGSKYVGLTMGSENRLLYVIVERDWRERRKAKKPARHTTRISVLHFAVSDSASRQAARRGTNFCGEVDGKLKLRMMILIRIKIKDNKRQYSTVYCLSGKPFVSSVNMRSNMCGPAHSARNSWEMGDGCGDEMMTNHHITGED